MFAKSTVSKSMIDAVNQVLGEQQNVPEELLVEDANNPHQAAITQHHTELMKAHQVGNKEAIAHHADELNKAKDRFRAHRAANEPAHVPPKPGSIEHYYATARRTNDSVEIDTTGKEIVSEKEESRYRMTEGFKDALKKSIKAVGKALGGPDDEGQKKDLQRKMGIPQTGKPSMAKQNEETVEEELKGGQKKIDKNHNGKIDGQDFKILRGQKKANEEITTDTLVGQTKGGKSNAFKSFKSTLKGDIDKTPAAKEGKPTAQHKVVKAEEVQQEGWDDMVKDTKERMGSGPKPSGGSGVKKGSRYGGSKQKDEPEETEKKTVKENKGPESDTVPFVTNDSTPISVARDTAQRAMKRIKTEMMGKIAN